jgi:hypothetical protein
MKRIAVLASVALLTLSSTVLASDYQIFFDRNKSRTSESVPNLSGSKQPVKFIGMASIPGGKRYNYNLALNRARYVARRSHARSPIIKSLGSSEATGNEPYDRRVDIVFLCDAISGQFPCTSAYSESFMKDLPECCRTGLIQVNPTILNTGR